MRNGSNGDRRAMGAPGSRRTVPAILGAVILASAVVGMPGMPARAVTPDLSTSAGDAAATVLADPGVSGVPVTSNGITITPYYCTPDTPTQTYTVPADAHSIYVEAVGGQGQTPDPGTTGIGGLAGQVTGVLSVMPGDEFDVQVGCAGDSDGGASAYAPGGAKGTGWSHLNDFATVYSFGYDGGGGGGASAVLDMQNGAEPVAVAAGGGGAGADAPNCLESNADDGYLFFFYCGPGLSTQQGGDGGDGAGNDTFGAAGANNSEGSTPDGLNCEGPKAGGKGSDFRTTGGGGAGGGGGGGYAGDDLGGGGCGGAAGQEADISSPADKVIEGSAGSGGGGGASYTGTLNNAAIDLAEDAGDGYVLFLTAADGIQTTHFSFSGDYEAFCVPDGVNELFVDVLGGAGGGGGSDFPDRTGTGGGGGGVQAVIPVTERTLLQIGVGEYGHASGGWGDGHGGDRGTSGSEGDGAGGGGSSAVKQSTSECVDRPDPAKLPGLTYLAVGGGGGGGGGYGVTASGGDGGAAGSPGSDGEVGGDPNGGAAGCGGAPVGNDDCEGGTRGGDATGSTDGGGGGGGGGGYLAGGKGHGVQNGELGGGGGGGGGNTWATNALKEAEHFYTGPDGERRNRDGVNDGHVDLIIPVPSTRSQVRIISGNQQSAQANEAFAAPLIIEFVDALKGPTANTEVTLDIGRVGNRLPATFAGGGASITVVTDANGRASIPVTTTPGTPVGQFTVIAHVTDDPAKQIKAAEFTLFDVATPTKVALSSDATVVDTGGVATVGQPVTFTAVTTRVDPEGPVAQGAVQFSLDGTDLGSPVSVSAAGVAESPPWVAASGQHHVLATYVDVEGGSYATTFANYALRVTAPETSATSLTSSMPNGLYGDETVDFSVAVTATGAGIWNPTGTVQLYSGTAPLGDPIELDAKGAGVSATFPADAFDLGTNKMTAVYSGDEHVESSVSDVVDLFVIDFGARPRPGSTSEPAPTTPSGSASGSGRDLAVTGATLVGAPLAILLLGAGSVLVLVRRRRLPGAD